MTLKCFKKQISYTLSSGYTVEPFIILGFVYFLYAG